MQSDPIWADVEVDMEFERSLGLGVDIDNQDEERKRFHLYINLKLAASGMPTCMDESSSEFMEISQDLLKAFREKGRLLSSYLCPSDQRIQDFLGRYLRDLDLERMPVLPNTTFILDRHGVARELSLPMGEDEFHSDIVSTKKSHAGDFIAFTDFLNRFAVDGKI